MKDYQVIWRPSFEKRAMLLQKPPHMFQTFCFLFVWEFATSLIRSKRSVELHFNHSFLKCFFRISGDGQLLFTTFLSVKSPSAGVDQTSWKAGAVACVPPGAACGREWCILWLQGGGNRHGWHGWQSPLKLYRNTNQHEQQPINNTTCNICGLFARFLRVWKPR